MRAPPTEGAANHYFVLKWHLRLRLFWAVPHHPMLIYAWYDYISMPNTILLEINVTNMLLCAMNMFSSHIIDLYP